MCVPIWGLAKGQAIFKLNRRVMVHLMPSIKEVKCIMNPLDGGHSTAANTWSYKPGDRGLQVADSGLHQCTSALMYSCLPRADLLFITLWVLSMCFICGRFVSRATTRETNMGLTYRTMEKYLPNDGAVREVWRRLKSDVLVKASPETKIMHEYKYEACWPRIEASYADGSVRKWWAHVLPAQTLLAEVFMYAQMAYNNPNNPSKQGK